MKRILVSYATNAGSTSEIAEAVAEGLDARGADVHVKAIDAVSAPDPYDAVVVGAPMIFGWHREARAFLKRHRGSLQHVPVACFMVALSLTEDTRDPYSGIDITLDPSLAKPPAHPHSLSFQERFTSVTNYVRPVLQSAPAVAPVSIGFFNGKLDYGRLRLLERWFVRLAFNAREGDFRNWDCIRGWSEGLFPELELGA
jgi:menaquinone-dependent protoporphyrinogen IX oxidase